MSVEEHAVSGTNRAPRKRGRMGWKDYDTAGRDDEEVPAYCATGTAVGDQPLGDPTDHDHDHDRDRDRDHDPDPDRDRDHDHDRDHDPDPDRDPDRDHDHDHRRYRL